MDELETCRRLYPVVRLAARRRGVRPDELDEVVQDTLIEILEALRNDRIHEPERIGAFASAVTRHMIADRARRAERRQRLLSTFGATIEVVVREENAIAYADRIRLEDCIAELGARAREIVRRTWFADDPPAAIARDLSTSEGNVRVLRHRALAELRDCMGRGEPA